MSGEISHDKANIPLIESSVTWGSRQVREANSHESQTEGAEAPGPLETEINHGGMKHVVVPIIKLRAEILLHTASELVRSVSFLGRFKGYR
jgi:hypothetical protein